MMIIGVSVKFSLRNMEKQIFYKNIEQYGSQNATHKEFPSKTLSQQENAEIRYWNSNDWLNC